MLATIRRILGEGYRFFFLAAGLFAVFSMIVWEGWIAIHAAGGMVELKAAQAPHLWHAHEMIFGYGTAAVAGFLLTAVPNWTGTQGARTAFITVAALLWLLGRVAMFLSAGLPPVAVALADLAFLPLLGVKILAQLVKRPKPQNMIFLALIALLWVSNLLCHLEWMGHADDGAWAGLRGGLLTLAALIVILGGRVTPAFTRNAMLRAGRENGLPENPPGLAAIAIAPAAALAPGYLLGVPDPILAGLAIMAGLAVLARLALWRGGWTWNQPILWSLHLSYGLNGLGLGLLGLAGIGIGSEIAALHVLGIGGVGGMTLAVMSRATLGHSGRELVAPGPVAVAYGLVPMAALARFAGSAWPSLYHPAVLAAGALWLVAFTLYLAGLWQVFCTPRPARAPVHPPPKSTPRGA